MTAEGGHPTPGWYPDPSGVHWWRWWDGSQWTDHTSGEGDASPSAGAAAPFSPVAVAAAAPAMPPSASVPWATPDGVPPSVRFASELRLSPWGILGFIGFGVESALNLLRYSGAHQYYQDLFRTYRSDFHAGVFNASSLPTEPSWAATLGLFSTVVVVGTFVCVLLWQYRAARTGRSLGYPSRLGPGLGVGGWFIPVVNLWFPYQALRDCLPAGHRSRRWLLAWWFLYIVGGVLSFAGIYLIYRGSGAYLPVLGAGFVCQVVFAVGGAEYVRAVRADHLSRLAGPRGAF